MASGDGGGDLDVDVVIRSLDVLARCVSYTPRITNEILERTSNHELSKVDTQYQQNCRLLALNNFIRP